MHSDTQSFIVRIWHEAVDGDGKVLAWRGSIDHVGNARRLHFQDLEEVVRFIAEETCIQTENPALRERDNPG